MRKLSSPHQPIPTSFATQKPALSTLRVCVCARRRRSSGRQTVCRSDPAASSARKCIAAIVVVASSCHQAHRAQCRLLAVCVRAPLTKCILTLRYSTQPETAYSDADEGTSKCHTAGKKHTPMRSVRHRSTAGDHVERRKNACDSLTH